MTRGVRCVVRHIVSLRIGVIDVCGIHAELRACQWLISARLYLIEVVRTGSIGVGKQHARALAVLDDRVVAARHVVGSLHGFVSQRRTI